MKFLVVVLSICAVAHGYVPQLDGRIIGGEAVEIEDFPYQVSVRIYDQHICGGSILDMNTILTAAHCAYGMDHTQFTVRTGATRHASGTSFRVSLVRVNANYNPNTNDNDMAILKLTVSMDSTLNVQPVALQPQGEEVLVGTTAWVSGWGVTTDGSNVIPDALRAVDVDVISNDLCNSMYGNDRITSHMMCAQTLGHDSCQGDSGGPLVANGKLIGIVSWGYGCNRPQYPGVYAKVSSMRSWIDDNRS